ncbi:Rad1/Rec1/Rad17 [Absidia repens]|uniref:Rad1/Rec1/Rad17 n=1 Tax=Absidia repens TaxID=90262 RepID=A0A1X2IL18_9FUNG|nr:Rad1/Rec1/Rad17 [Absidia repens]
MTFSATLNTIKLLTGMIKAIQFRSTATCSIHEEGLTFTVTESQSIKAIAYAKRSMFERYRRGTDIVPDFDIHLGAFVDCLGILCPAAALDECQIQYEGVGSPLILTRTDSEKQLTNTCKIQTLEPEPDIQSLSMYDSDTEQTVIMKASWLQDALGDLDSTCDRVSIVFSEQDPCFQLFGTGTNGTSSITEYHEDYAEPFISFDCSREGTYKYLYSHISRCTKALDQASDVSLKISKEGVLHLLFKMGSNANDDAAYVEFTIIPCID